MIVEKWRKKKDDMHLKVRTEKHALSGLKGGRDSPPQTVRKGKGPFVSPWGAAGRRKTAIAWP